MFGVAGEVEIVESEDVEPLFGLDEPSPEWLPKPRLIPIPE